jgi:hypothetical protein
MKNIIAFFKKIIEFILNILCSKQEYEPVFITFDGDELITSDEKIFLIKGEK